MLSSLKGVTQLISSDFGVCFFIFFTGKTMSQSCSTTCKPQLTHHNFWHCWKVFCLVLSEMLNIMHLRIKDLRMPSRGML